MEIGKRSSRILTKAAISAVGAAAFALHAFSDHKLDVTGIALLFLALLPWLATLLTRAELPGGWKLEFQAVKSEQHRQANEIAAMKFLLTYFLTEHECKHLERLAAEKPFHASRGPTTSFFETEMRRLKSLGFIEGLPQRGIRSLLQAIGNANGKEIDVKDHFEITSRGREYLALRNDMLTEAASPPADVHSA